MPSRPLDCRLHCCGTALCKQLDDDSHPVQGRQDHPDVHAGWAGQLWAADGQHQGQRRPRPAGELQPRHGLCAPGVSFDFRHASNMCRQGTPFSKHDSQNRAQAASRSTAPPTGWRTMVASWALCPRYVPSRACQQGLACCEHGVADQSTDSIRVHGAPNRFEHYSRDIPRCVL